jgi:hypothetical protein
MIIGLTLFVLLQGIVNAISNNKARYDDYPDDYPIPFDIPPAVMFAIILLGLIASPIILPLVTIVSIGSLLSFIFSKIY